MVNRLVKHMVYRLPNFVNPGTIGFFYKPLDTPELYKSKDDAHMQLVIMQHNALMDMKWPGWWRCSLREAVISITQEQWTHGRRFTGKRAARYVEIITRD